MNGGVIMLCVGKKFLEFLVGVIVMNESNIVIVKGLKGELICIFYFEIEIKVEDNVLVVNCFSDNKEYCVFYGIICSFLGNMVEGVIKGFECGLELVGVGYCV